MVWAHAAENKLKDERFVQRDDKNNSYKDS